MSGKTQATVPGPASGSRQDAWPKILKPLLLAAAAILLLLFATDQLTSRFILETPKALFLLVVIYLVGFCTLTLGRKAPRSREPFEYIGAGLAMTVLYFFMAAMAHALQPIVFAAYFLSPLPMGLLIFRHKKLRERFFDDIRKVWQRHGLEWAAFFPVFLYALLPTVFFDSLVYVNGLPNFFLQNGGFIETPQFMFANGFVYYETSLLPAVFLGDQVPRLLHFFLGVLFILAVLDHGCREFHLQKRLVLLLTLLSLPLTFFLLATEKADLITAMFIFLAIKKYFEDEPRLSAIFWGMAIGCKSFSALALAVFIILVIVSGRKLQLKKHATMLALIFITGAPLLVKNWIFAGNPFFPFLSPFFPNPYWDASRLQPVIAEVGTRIASIKDLLLAPYEFSFKTQGAGGLVGPIFLITLPFLLLGTIKKEKKFYLYFPLLLLLVSSFFGNAFRYIYIVFVLLAIPVAAVYEQHQGWRFFRFIFASILLVNFAAGLYMLEGIYEARRVYFEKTPPWAYTTSRFPMYPVYQMLNARTSRDARILVAGETRGYYLKRPYMIASAHDYSILKKYVTSTTDAGSFVSAIKTDGFDYLVFDLAEFTRLASYKPLSQEETKKLFGYLGVLRPIFKNNSIYVYKL